jgi:hypothetical protein
MVPLLSPGMPSLATAFVTITGEETEPAMRQESVLS